MLVEAPAPKPCLGSIKLESLTTQNIQEFYNTRQLIKALKGHKYENLILTTLFTGFWEGKICGLQWGCVNLETFIQPVSA